MFNDGCKVAALLSVGTKKYRQAQAGVMLAGFTAFGAQYCIQPIIKVLADDFALTPTAASLAVSSGMVGMALMLLALATFADRLPRKKVVAVSLLVSVLVTVGLSLSHNFVLLVGLRFLQGAVLAAVPILIMAYANEMFDEKTGGVTVSLYVAGASFGGLFGRCFVSILTDSVGWRQAVFLAAVVFAVLTLAFCYLLPAEHAAGKNSAKKFSLDVFTWQNKKLFGLCLIAFAMMGSFVGTYNFIGYFLQSPPYNLSQTAVGALFAVQLFGAFSAMLMGKLSNIFGNAKIIAFNLLVLLGGAWVTLLPPLLFKILGLALVTSGLFGAHASACAWCHELTVTSKAGGSSLYMFLYYCGASILGSTAGLFYESCSWPGVVGMVTGCMLFSLLLLCLISSKKKV